MQHFCYIFTIFYVGFFQISNCNVNAKQNNEEVNVGEQYQREQIYWYPRLHKLFGPKGESSLTPEQRIELLNKYSKYIGFIGRCTIEDQEKVTKIDNRKNCQMSKIGVFIYHNLLLTNFALNLPELNALENGNNQSHNLIGAYIGGANVNSDLYSKDVISYSEVHSVEDWRLIMNSITGVMSGPYEYLVSTLPFIQLAIIVGKTPFNMDGKSMDYMTIPVKTAFGSESTKADVKNKKCFTFTYGTLDVKQYSKVKVLPANVIKSDSCKIRISPNVLIEPLCIQIKGDMHVQALGGGEPVICDDELLCIVSNANIYDRNRNLYPCTSIYEHRNWIRKHIARYGIGKYTYWYKYSKYMGMVVGCYEYNATNVETIPREYCSVDNIGVVIYNNILLTNGIKRRGKFTRRLNILRTYMGKAKGSLDLVDTRTTNITRILQPDDRHNGNTIHKSIDLAIVVGERPIFSDRKHTDVISLPAKPLYIKNDKCFMLTYGPKLKTSFNSSSVHINRIALNIFEMKCSPELNSSKTLKEFCFSIVAGNTNNIPHGGEPIICNGVLHGIATNKMCATDKDYEYYIFTNIYKQLDWIKHKIALYGLKDIPKMSSHEIYCRNNPFLLLITLFFLVYHTY